MQRAVTAFLTLLIFGGLAYSYRMPLKTFAAQLYAYALPCTQPITYSLGAIDPRFSIASSSVIDALNNAAEIWDGAAGRTLFAYVPSGGEVTVTFVYDDRQETAVKLRSLGISITTDKASYDAVNAEYQQLNAAYATEKATFDTQNVALKEDVAAYERDVEAANARGGAAPAEYAQLQREKAALTTRQDNLVALEKRVNTDADDVNAIITTLNRLAASVNTDAVSYNGTAGDSEFEEADFESAPGHESINVFEFDSSARLTRVLAHEFGHALGMQHVDDPDAIMYRLNQSANQRPTDADLTELDTVCRQK